MDGLFYQTVVEIRGMDRIIGVVKLDIGFDVLNLNAIVLVAFLKFIA